MLSDRYSDLRLIIPQNLEIADPMAAESAFRKFVEDERFCRKAKAV
jgi:hypothetical protein